MKTKAILFIGAAALVTLSFTFVNTGKNKNARIDSSTAEQGAPAGGFGAEEIVK